MAKVVKRKGKWIVDYRISSGRRTPSFPNKKAAEEFHKELLLRKSRLPKRSSSLSSTLRDSINKYFDLISAHKNPVSQSNEKVYFERLYEYFGNTVVSEVSVVSLEEFKRFLLKRYGFKKSTLKRHFNTYKNFFKKCEDWGFILKNPCSRLEPITVEEFEKRIWNDDEIALVLSHSQPWAADLFLSIALTGMRRSEVVRLQWRDVDLSNRSIEVFSYKGSGRKRKRIIPMTEDLIQLFNTKYSKARKSFIGKPTDFVFRNASGKPVTAAHVSREMQRLVTKLGLKGLNLHGLRHTFLTRMAAQNISLEKVRRIAGHSSLTTTQQYLHMSSEDLHSAVHEVNKGRVLKMKQVGDQ